MKNPLIACLFTLLAAAPAAQAQVWCHAQSVDASAPHLNLNPQIDFRVNFDGGGFVAGPVWLNITEGSASLPNNLFARITSHWKGQNEVGPWKRLDHDGRKLTGEVTVPERIGGRGGPELEYWQTLDLAYGSEGGPTESHNFNLSKTYKEAPERCLRGPGE